LPTDAMKTDATDDRSKYPELLADLADQVAGKLAELGIAAEKAADIGWHVAEHIREHWSGASQYFPKGQEYVLSIRDRKIYAEFNGTNHGDLARQHGLTEMRIYQIIKTARAAHVKRLQGALF
jgi:Mor family transcriptional regulator